MTVAHPEPMVLLPRAVLNGVSAESPGDGKTKSSPSTEAHCSFGMLMTNMFGRALKTSLLSAPPETVMGAQFMYLLSRLAFADSIANILNSNAEYSHLAIPDLVEPCPRETVLAVRHTLRNRELEHAGTRAIRVFGEIAGSVGRATSNDGVNDLPLTMLRGLFVECDGDLARSATVRCAALEGQALRDTDRHLVHFGDIVDAGALFAGEVGAIVDERAVGERTLSEGYGRGDDHVRGDGGGEHTAQSCAEDGVGELHDDDIS